MKAPPPQDGLAIDHAFDLDAHHGQVLVALRHLPGRDQELGGEVDGPHRGFPDRNRLLAEETGVAQHRHLLAVARVAQGLLHHLRDLGGLEQRAQPVGEKGLESADAGNIERLDLRQRRPHHHLAAHDQPRRPRVLGDDVDRREPGLVLERPVARHRQAADVTAEGVDPIPGGERTAEDEVRAAGRHAAVHHRGDAALPGDRVERPRVLLEEGDVDDVDARLDDPPQGGKAHRPGHRADREIVPRDETRDFAGPAEIGALGRQPRQTREPRQRRLGDVGHRELETPRRGQIAGDRLPHPAGPQHDHLHAHLRSGSVHQTDQRLVRGLDADSQF